MQATKLTTEQKRDLCQRQFFLNGMPAKVCGALNQFATVRQLNGPLSVEFSWAAIARIAAAGGYCSAN